MKIKIGSRGSRLAVAQAQAVRDALKAADVALDIELVRIVTTGDRETTAPLSAIGGKGVFVKEIEEALLRKDIDLAVHSLKDLPQMLPAGLTLGAFPKREDIRDVLISRFGEQLRELPKGSTVGTGAPRRVAQIRRAHWKRGYRLEPIRGNVDTRLKKVQDGQYDAIVLAAAGLKRLGLESEITEYLEPDAMLPAPGQGCLGLEAREDHPDIFKIIATIKHPESDATARAERAFLQGIGGDCNIAVGAYSTFVGNSLAMKAIVLDASGEKAVVVAQSGDAAQPEFVGAQLAGRLLHEGGSEILLGMSPPAP